MDTTRRRLGWLFSALLLAGAGGAAPAPPRVLPPDAQLPALDLRIDLGERRWDPSDEEAQADETNAALQRELKPLDDPVSRQRVEAIMHRIVTAAYLLGPRQVGPGGKSTAPMPVTVRLVDVDDPNAFATWNGSIYVTRGMLEFCQSDHELASVLGHEFAHAMLHHMRQQTERLRRFNTQELLVLLGGLAGALVGQVEPADVMTASTAVMMVHYALMSGYSVEAETEADYVGCFYTYRAGFNPVGAVTVMERLHRLWLRTPQPEMLGVAQTHPWSDDRARKLEAQIRALGLPVNRREVTDAITAGYRVTPATDSAPESVELLLGDSTLLVLATAGECDSPADRAAAQAMRLNRALWLGVRSSDLALQHLDGRYAIRAVVAARAEVLVEILAADAAAQGLPVADYAKQVYNRLIARLRTDEIVNGAV